MPELESTQLRLMVSVKAYPTPSTKYEETVCCAGISEDLEWIRLYPVPYRDLPGLGKFRKYDIVEVTAVRREPGRLLEFEAGQRGLSGFFMSMGLLCAPFSRTL